MVEVVQQAAAKYREVLKQEKELEENKEKLKHKEEAKKKKKKRKRKLEECKTEQISLKATWVS